jgi:hypothetical protein
MPSEAVTKCLEKLKEIIDGLQQEPVSLEGHILSCCVCLAVEEIEKYVEGEKNGANAKISDDELKKSLIMSPYDDRDNSEDDVWGSKTMWGGYEYNDLKSFDENGDPYKSKYEDMPALKRYLHKKRNPVRIESIKDDIEELKKLVRERKKNCG